MKATPTTASHPLISKREAAEILGCNISTVNRLTTNGALAHAPESVKVGDKITTYLFDRATVERLATKRAAA